MSKKCQKSWFSGNGSARRAVVSMGLKANSWKRSFPFFLVMRISYFKNHDLVLDVSKSTLKLIYNLVAAYLRQMESRHDMGWLRSDQKG